MKYGYLRETKELAEKAGVDPVTGVVRTGLDEYLSVIFPKTTDWIHDKAIGEINGVKYRCRPDYFSPSLKLIVEFDGMPHYQNPDIIIKDRNNTKIYESGGYKVVRIPYFIQLTKKAVKELFGVDVKFELFDESIPSISGKERSSPAYLCYLGIKRMAEEFKKFPEQYEANVKQLREENCDELTGLSLLEKEYNSI